MKRLSEPMNKAIDKRRTMFMIHTMNKERPSHAPADPASNEPSEARAESCTCCSGGREPDPTDDNLRTLRSLKELSMAVARKLAARILDDDAPHQAAPDQPGDTPKQHDKLSAAALAFQRAERGVRQNILLSNKLHDDRLARETQKAAVSAEAEQQRRERRKRQVKRLAKEAIRRSTGDRAERLEKLDARIDEEDIDSDIGRLADSAIIARLLQDCGVAVPWDLWAGEHWAQEEIRLEPAGSAYAGWSPAAPPEPEPEEAEPVEVKSPQPAPLQPKADEPVASAAEPPEPRPDEVESIEAEPPRPEPLQPEAEAPTASAPERPEPEPPEPEPDNPYEARMKARLAMALHSGAWIRVLQTDPMLASYVQARLNDSS
jgi:hypothetical protein